MFPLVYQLAWLPNWIKTATFPCCSKHVICCKLGLYATRTVQPSHRCTWYFCRSSRFVWFQRTSLFSRSFWEGSREALDLGPSSKEPLLLAPTRTEFMQQLGVRYFVLSNRIDLFLARGEKIGCRWTMLQRLHVSDRWSVLQTTFFSKVVLCVFYVFMAFLCLYWLHAIADKMISKIEVSRQLVGLLVLRFDCFLFLACFCRTATTTNYYALYTPPSKSFCF